MANPCELVALDAEALVALLKYWAPTRPPEVDALSFRLARGSLTATLLSGLAPVTVTSAVQPCGGWMARLCDASALVDERLPVWRVRWLGREPMHVTLVVDGEPFGLRLGATVQRDVPGDELVNVSHQAVVQLTFAYGSAYQLLGHGVEAAPTGLAALATLVSHVCAGVAPTDEF